MNWDDIRFFLALVETPTLTEAAATLGVGDATVMRHVQALETNLGATLFLRTRTGHELTPSGERLLDRAREMEQVADAIRGDMTGEDDTLSGTVIIATTEFGADHVLGPALPALKRVYPDLMVMLHVAPEHFDLTRPQAWLALRFRRPERGPYLIRKIADVPWGLYAARPLANDLRLAPGDRITGRETYIDWAPPVDNIRVALSVRRSFARGKASVAVPSLRGQLDAARSGLGIAHLPRLLGDRDGDLVSLCDTKPEIVLEAWLVQPRQFRHLARTRVAADFVTRALREAMGRTGA